MASFSPFLPNPIIIRLLLHCSSEIVLLKVNKRSLTIYSVHFQVFWRPLFLIKAFSLSTSVNILSGCHLSNPLCTVPSLLFSRVLSSAHCFSLSSLGAFLLGFHYSLFLRGWWLPNFPSTLGSLMVELIYLIFQKNVRFWLCPQLPLAHFFVSSVSCTAHPHLGKT